MGIDLPKGLKQLGYGNAYREDIINMMEETIMFSDFSRRELEQLADYMHAYEAGVGTVVFKEGNKDSYLCVVIEGKLDVFKESGKGDKKLATIRPGKVIGEMAIIDEQPHSATVVAKSDSILLLATKHTLNSLFDEQPRLAYRLLWKIAQLLSHRLRQTSGMLVDYL